MLRIIKGNIFNSQCQTLVNTVNCVGVMGAGIALEFKLRFPKMFERYEKHCHNGAMDIGKLWLYDKESPWILNFPTKKHWKDPSRKSYLHEGLKRFVETYKQRGIESIAFPALGTLNGKLPEDEAIAIMVKHLYVCDIDIDIYIYDRNAEDDWYRKIKQKFERETIEDLASETGLSVHRISALHEAFGRSDIHTISQLTAHKGIGVKTLEVLFRNRGTGSTPTRAVENPNQSSESVQGALL